MDGLLAGMSVQVVAAATLASCTAAILAIILLRRYSVAAGARIVLLPDAVEPDERLWVFKGHSLWNANAADRAWLEAASGLGDAYSGLEQLMPPDGQMALDRLIRHGMPFSSCALTADGSGWIISGTVRGHAAVIRLRPDPDAPDNSALSRKIATEIADKAPMPIWKTDRNGTLLWANPAFNSLSGGARLGEDVGAKFFQHNQNVEPERTTAYLTVDAGDEDQRTFEATHVTAENGSTLSFANDISRQLEAEGGMSRFLTTMAETFAHLPIGMAVFNGSGALRVFNPALVDLIGLEPGWLAGEPGLGAFFEALRENRLMPEEPNKKAWRARVEAIEAQARADVWSEQWDLANGQCIKATGRSHPNNAVAFLFEDVTINSTLKRKYQAELDQSRVTLNHLNDAVAVFDPAGRVALCNPAFLSMWRFTTSPETVGQVASECAAACTPNEMWQKLRVFVTSSHDRSVWTSDVALKDGRSITGRFAPMPDGATLAVFAQVEDGSAVQVTPPSIEVWPTDAAADIAAHLPASLTTQDRTDITASIMGLSALAQQTDKTDKQDCPPDVARLASLMARIASAFEAQSDGAPEVSRAGRDWVLRMPLPQGGLRKDSLSYRLFARVCTASSAQIILHEDALECVVTPDASSQEHQKISA